MEKVQQVGIMLPGNV